MTAVRTGMARPCSKTQTSAGENGEKPKEDGILTSQKLLLTWMIDDAKLFLTDQQTISARMILPEELYRKVAELLYEQYERTGS